jgi:hypothetical protein
MLLSSLYVHFFQQLKEKTIAYVYRRGVFSVSLTNEKVPKLLKTSYQGSIVSSASDYV